MKSLTNIYGIPTLNFEVGILTPRELEVMKIAFLPGKHIADELHIHISTVNTHLKNIKNKTKLADSKEMAWFAGYLNGLEQGNEIIN